MIKNFFKNNPIHKKIVPSLDFLMLLRPTLFFSVWVMICIGMYISSILNDSIQMNITSYNLLTVFMFFGISMVCGATFIINQIADIESDNINKKVFLLDEVISLEKALLATKTVSIVGFFTIAFVDIYLLLPIGIIFMIWGRLYNDQKFNWKSRPLLGLLANIFCGYLLILIGILFNNNFSSHVFIIYESLLYCTPFILAYSSVVMLANIPDVSGDKEIEKNTFTVVYGVRVTVLAAALLCLLSFSCGLYLEEPLSTISSLSALPFFLFALLRGKQKDIIRAIRYPIFLLHFYVFTIYPLLFFPIVFFYLVSKYYYWHRFSIHYPTLLVEND